MKNPCPLIATGWASPGAWTSTAMALCAPPACEVTAAARATGSSTVLELPQPAAAIEDAMASEAATAAISALRELAGVMW